MIGKRLKIVVAGVLAMLALAAPASAAAAPTVTGNAGAAPAVADNAAAAPTVSSIAGAAPAVADSAAAAPPPLGVHGNRLTANGHAVRLLGVDRSGTEYACAQGYGFTDSPRYRRPDSGALIAAMRNWRVNAVLIPLNEACWLGINGVKARLGGHSYRAKVTTYIGRLEAAGIHPILDLHEAVPRHYPARKATRGLRPAPDRSHSLDFWRSLARRFGDDRAIVFDLYNEPNGIGWRCLRHGCLIRHDHYLDDLPAYRSVGTQHLVRAIRRAGARNVIMVPGLSYTSNLSRWLRYRPHDPLHRVVASLHTYEHPLSGCGPRCRHSVLAPLAKRVPIITGEMGDTDCNHDYIDSYMRFADRHKISYVGWAWDATAGGSWTCTGGPSLIRRYDGTPTGYGIGLRDHLRALAAG